MIGCISTPSFGLLPLISFEYDIAGRNIISFIHARPARSEKIIYRFYQQSKCLQVVSVTLAREFYRNPKCGWCS